MRTTLGWGIGAAVLSLVVSVSGQEPGSDPDRTVAARPWPPERLPDGQPDVQGFWVAEITGTVTLTNPMNAGTEFRVRTGGTPVQNPSRIADPPDGQVPYQPWAAARQQQQALDYEHPTSLEHVDTQVRCLLGGVPRPFYNTRFRILQPPGLVVIVWDDYHSFRVIPLDGRPHVDPKVKLWMGDSRGHWEGRTLVVDVTNLNAKSRLTYVGDFFSDQVHIVERLTFADAGTLTYDATIDDPTVFTRPWTLRVPSKRAPDDEMWEFACHEGDHGSGQRLANPENK